MLEPLHHRPRILFFVSASLIVLFVASVALYIQSRRQTWQGARLRVSSTSPAEVSARYRETLSAYASTTLAQGDRPCGSIIPEARKVLETIRVPKEKQAAHLNAFFALGNISPNETACKEIILRQIDTLIQRDAQPDTAS